MRKIANIILALVLVTALVVVSPVFAISEESEEFINPADAELIAAVNDALTYFVEVIEAGESDEEIVLGIEESILALYQLTEHEFDYEVSQEYSNQTSFIKQKADNLQMELVSLRQIYQADTINKEEASDIISRVDVAVDEYTVAVEGLDELLDNETALVNSSDNFYPVLLMIMLVLVFGSFVWAFMWPEVVAEHLKSRHQIAYYSLVPLAGSVVVYIGNRWISGSNEHMIAWGAIIFGLIVYLKAVLDYRKLVKTID
ncbi:MAG: hypothetical protein ACOX0Z_00305 [Candidatus Nanosyncoccaceae bacterium]|jgi:hypothetical protein